MQSCQFCAVSELFINPFTQQFAFTAYCGSRNVLDGGDMTVTREDMILEFMSLKFHVETHRWICNYKMEKDLEVKKCYIQEYRIRKWNSTAKKKEEIIYSFISFLLECRGNEFNAKSMLLNPVNSFDFYLDLTSPQNLILWIPLFSLSLFFNIWLRNFSIEDEVVRIVQ